MNANPAFQQRLAGKLKSAARVPRADFSFQIKLADVAIVLLFAAGSWAGFPGFAKLSEVKSQTASLEYKPVWMFLLFAFNYLVIYRKLAKGYFSLWSCALHAFIVNALITFGVWIVATQSLLNSMSGSDALIVVQCGMAAIYLVVQNWFDFKFDIRSLGDLSRKIDEKASYLESLRGTVIDEAAVRDVKELCGKFARDVDTAISDGWRDENVKSSLKGEKLRIKSIQDALKGLSSEIPGALARAKAAYNQEVVSGCVKEENTILPPDTRNKDRPA